MCHGAFAQIDRLRPACAPVGAGAARGQSAPARHAGLADGGVGVITNTSTTAVLIPVVVEIARRIKMHPGRFLLPVAFASMMGGSATLIGTSTNLAASGVLARLGLAPFGVFEFALVGNIRPPSDKNLSKHRSRSPGGFADFIEVVRNVAPS